LTAGRAHEVDDEDAGRDRRLREERESDEGDPLRTAAATRSIAGYHV
jgi:hypothetical protein